MDEIHFINFKRAHPNTPVPKVVPAPEEDLQLIQACLRRTFIKHELPVAYSVEASLADFAVVVESYDACSDSFNLRELLYDLDFPIGDQVYIDNLNFGDTDIIDVDDLALYFDDFWYPSSDDIFIIDKELRWLVVITHCGDVRPLVLDC